MYKDPQESWDKIVEERILEEIRKEGFDKFTVIDEEAGKTFLEFKVKKNVKPDKKKKVRKKK
jgi:fructose-1,6-bisphosphatase/inositol monophosphatase family enzyme|tara:strand:+ start:1448 stop:1633 length:186 start_codon:yes stop_codon:yes gene_type:complete